jgi:hypothetical protein
MPTRGPKSSMDTTFKEIGCKEKHIELVSKLRTIRYYFEAVETKLTVKFQN